MIFFCGKETMEELEAHFLSLAAQTLKHKTNRQVTME